MNEKRPFWVRVKGFVRHPLCGFGLHDVFPSTRWVPSIHAKIVTEFHQVCRCTTCGKVVGETHERWNGREMIPILPNAKHHPRAVASRGGCSCSQPESTTQGE